MVKKIIKTNPNLIELINKLNKKSKTENAAIWKDVANRLGRSNRRTAEVNLSDIARYANADETVLVPGKVLSNGDLTEKVNVAAFKFSQKAQEKIESAGGECVSIDDIMESNPKGSNIRIMEEDGCVVIMIIDGEGCVLGRLASVTSKNLLEGEEVVILNAEKIMITGNKDWAYAKYKQRVDRASISNPRDLGPKYPRRPDDIFRRTVRGMLPYKKSKGRVAFKGLKAYVGVPEEYADADLVAVPEAEYNNLKKGIELGEVSKLLGATF